jgi:hypothetical protein
VRVCGIDILSDQARLACACACLAEKETDEYDCDQMLREEAKAA